MKITLKDPILSPLRWSVDKDRNIVDGNGELVVRRVPLPPELSKREEANAHLIGAAPDLLEACLQLRWKVDETQGYPEIRRDVVLGMVRDAIAKARNLPAPVNGLGPLPRCKTCGEEIDNRKNGSVFGEGECGECEYRRYKSQPELLAAAGTALEEIERWVDVMGGTDDWQKQEAIDALVAAIDFAENGDRESSE